MAKSKPKPTAVEEPTVEVTETPTVTPTEEVAPPLLNVAVPEKVAHGYPSRDFYTAL